MCNKHTALSAGLANKVSYNSCAGMLGLVEVSGRKAALPVVVQFAEIKGIAGNASRSKALPSGLLAYAQKDEPRLKRKSGGRHAWELRQVHGRRQAQAAHGSIVSQDFRVVEPHADTARY